MRAVVLALTVALAACQQINLVPEFSLGKTYLYKYEAQATSGILQDGLARAGLKVTSKVLLTAVTENMFLMKLVDPVLFDYAGIWPKDPFTPANKLTAALAAQLQIPIKFEYVKGVVGKLFAPVKVTRTIMNLHRGILNILQLNLKKTQNIYELQEAGTQGVCRTNYIINEDLKGNRVFVSKSKDLNNCQEKVMKDFGLAYTERCTECTQRVSGLTEAASYTYIMKPAPTGILIAEAKVEELHEFSPFSEIHGAAVMETKQTLTFVELGKTPVVPFKAEYLPRGSIQYEFSTEVLQTPIQLMKITDVPTQVKEVLQHLVSNNVATVHEDANLKYIQLIQLLRVATPENIKAIWTQFKDKPLYRRWLLDALPAVGTPVIVKFIKEKFLAEELTMPEFIQTFVIALQMVPADLETIQLINSLAMNEKINRMPAVRKVVMLGYGSMIAKHCVAVPTCPSDLLRPIHEMAADALGKNNIPELSLVLKVLGNAGHPASLKTIMKLLPGLSTAAKTLPIRVKVDAVMALRNIAKKEPKLVQPLALQLLVDRTVHPEVRMVATIVLFETKPSVALVVSLAGALKMETNMHVASFAYSHIKSLTRITAPDMATVAAAANVAIKLLSRKLDRLSYMFSRALLLDIYHTPSMIGAAGSAFMINDAATILPRAVITKARAYLAGAVADVFEFGVRTEGIQESLLKSPAADESIDRLTKIKRTLRALTNWKDLPNNQPLASVYVKLFGQEVAYAHIDKTVIEQAIALSTGPRARELLKKALRALQEGFSMQYSKSLLAAEVRRILPTAVGVPMELSLYTTAVAAATLKVKATITPPLPEQLENFPLEQLKKTDVRMSVDAKTSVALQTFAVIGVNTALFQASVMARGKIRVILPGKISARADILKGNYKVEVLPVEVPEHVVAASLETYAVVRNIEEPNAERIVPLVPELSVENYQTHASSETSGSAMSNEVSWRAPPVHKNLCLEIQSIEIKGCIDVRSQNAAYIKNATLFYILGQHSAYIAIAKGDGPAVERLEFEIQFGARAAEILTKKNNVVDDETPEGKTILLKLREILGAEFKNTPSSSSSSNSNSNSNSSSSSSSSSSSKKRSDRSSSSSHSSMPSGSSSSSMSNAQMKRTLPLIKPFGKFHNDQYLAAHRASNRRSSGSSQSSFEAIQRQARFLGNTIKPAFGMVFRVLRVDRKLLGYQLGAYFDRQTKRVQIVISSIAENDNMKICGDGVVLSTHKVVGKVAWGPECQQYAVMAKAEAGVLGEFPAARLEIEWDRVPPILTTYAKRLLKYIPIAAYRTGFDIERTKNSEKEIEVTAALPCKRNLDVIARIPEMTLSRMGILLPFDVPINPDGTLSIHIDDGILNWIKNYWEEH